MLNPTLVTLDISLQGAQLRSALGILVSHCCFPAWVWSPVGGEDSQWLSLSSSWLLCHLQVTFVHWVFLWRFDAGAHKGFACWEMASLNPPIPGCLSALLHQPVCLEHQLQRNLCASVLSSFAVNHGGVVQKILSILKHF